MNPKTFVYLCALAILVGAGGGSLEQLEKINPFGYEIAEKPMEFHLRQARLGSKRVSDYKKMWAYQAISSTRPYYTGTNEKEPPCIPHGKRVLICDFRK